MAEKEVHGGVIRVNLDILREALRLPPETKITGVSQDVFFLTNEIAIRVEHPDLPRVRDGEIYNTVRPQLRVNANVLVPRIEWAGWGGSQYQETWVPDFPSYEVTLAPEVILER